MHDGSATLFYNLLFLKMAYVSLYLTCIWAFSIFVPPIVFLSLSVLRVLHLNELDYPNSRSRFLTSVKWNIAHANQDKKIFEDMRRRLGLINIEVN